MNISPAFSKSPQFVKLERALGVVAMRHIVMLGLHCQQNKSEIIEFSDIEDFEIMLDIREGGGDVLSALEGLGMIKRIDDTTFTCQFFVEQNKQLLVNWENGRKWKEKKEKEKRTTQSNSTQLNSIQLNSTNCLGSAMAVPLKGDKKYNFEPF
jgi:hypothetical protein